MAALIRSDAPPLEATISLPRPARAALVSWNARAPRGRIDLAVTFADRTRSPWLPFACWSEDERRSLGGTADELELAVDVARAATPFALLHARTDVALESLWLATPPERERAARALPSPGLDLDVPLRSQYCTERPGERGWCSPAALTMLLAFHGLPLEVPEVARAVYDGAYGGTGNWAFNAAFAGACGFAAATAYLRDLAQAARFIEAGLPLAVSLAWRAGELPGAPLPQSAGHLVVLRGFAPGGRVTVNDPAQPGVRTSYPADAFERLWLGHGGVAYLVAPRERANELIPLAGA